MQFSNTPYFDGSLQNFIGEKERVPKKVVIFYAQEDLLPRVYLNFCAYNLKLLPSN
jgi:hypothetical protein